LCLTNPSLDQRLDGRVLADNMTDIDGKNSVPTDKELIFWGWTTNQISHLRALSENLQRDVLTEYIRKFMENGDYDSVDF